jgi:ribosomal protein S12 methylthiotransferase
MSIKVGVTSLGCAKNLVDSEVILGYLREGGYDICQELDEAQVVIVNTCSFIRDAEEESGDAIRELIALKKKGELQRVIVAGCLPVRRGCRLKERFPGVDLFLHPFEIPQVARLVGGLMKDRAGATPHRPPADSGSSWFLYDHLSPRVKLSPPHYAYIKVSEGCGNRCGYCLIPSIKGRLTSRGIGSVLEEARNLASAGAREINLISQDTTSYGLDLYGEPRLADLLRGLAEIEGLTWIRVLYGHPAHYTEDLLRCIAGEPRVCAYVDFPLQHIADPILASMNRRMTRAAVIEKLQSVRRLIPGVTVRTTFIVGYPGETEAHFRELLEFVRESRFEHLGAFIYSREEGTAAAALPRQVAHEVKRERFHRLMALQQEIVRAANERMIGRVVKTMVDEEPREGSFRFKGRTEGDAPEVDGTVYFSGGDASPGSLVDVRVTGVTEYDLVGEMKNPKSHIPGPK